MFEKWIWWQLHLIWLFEKNNNKLKRLKKVNLEEKKITRKVFKSFLFSFKLKTNKSNKLNFDEEKIWLNKINKQNSVLNTVFHHG